MAAHNYAELLAPLALPPPPPVGDDPDGRQRLGGWRLPAPPRRPIDASAAALAAPDG